MSVSKATDRYCAGGDIMEDRHVSQYQWKSRRVHRLLRLDHGHLAEDILTRWERSSESGSVPPLTGRGLAETGEWNSTMVPCQGIGIMIRVVIDV